MRFFKNAAVHFFLAWVILAAILVTTSMAAGPAEGIHYDKKAGTLTLHVQEMPLNEVLQTVSAASGLKLSIQADLNRPVTMDFTAVPLDKAIHRLVQPNSSAMIYSKKEDGVVVLTSVKVFDKGGAPSSPENLPPITRPMVRNNRFAGGNADQAVGTGGAGGSPSDPGGGRNNKRNKGQRGASASPDSSAQTGAAAAAGGTQSTTGGSAGGSGGRGR